MHKSCCSLAAANCEKIASGYANYEVIACIYRFLDNSSVKCNFSVTFGFFHRFETFDRVWGIEEADWMDSAAAKVSGGMLILSYMKLQGNRASGWICICENQELNAWGINLSQ